MLAAKKPFKYYAIRFTNTVIFRRTVGTLQKVRSVLYKPQTDFRLEQVTYIGGKVIGCMPYYQWTRHGGKQFAEGKCLQLTREQYRALHPYVHKAKE